MIGTVASLPQNPEVAEQFELLADLLELEGAESFRVIAYRRAATRMRDTSGSIAQLALDGRAKELQGIGKTIEEKIVQIVEQGEIEALTKRKGSIPTEVVLFMRLPGLGPKTAARIWKELGISTLADLKLAAEHEQLRTLPGLAAKSEEKILKALAYQAENPDEGRRLLGDGLAAVQAAVAVLREHPAAVAVSEAGSVRRRKETFRDLDIIATATDPAELTAYFTQLPWVVDVVAHGDTKATVISNEGLRFDLRVVPPESFGNLLQHFTGSKDHNVAMREDAVRRGLSISEYGVTTVETGDVFSSEDEDAVYAFLGYQPIPPELRENGGELEAARRGELPTLVELGDLRGDLHTHTHWSADGKNTRAATSTTRSPITPITCARDASPPSSPRSSRCASGSRSYASSPASRRTSARTARSTCRRRSSHCSTGSSHRCTTRRTTGRPSACSKRWTIRTSTASGISPVAASARAPRATWTSSA